MGNIMMCGTLCNSLDVNANATVEEKEKDKDKIKFSIDQLIAREIFEREKMQNKEDLRFMNVEQNIKNLEKYNENVQRDLEQNIKNLEQNNENIQRDLGQNIKNLENSNENIQRNLGQIIKRIEDKIDMKFDIVSMKMENMTNMLRLPHNTTT